MKKTYNINQIYKDDIEGAKKHLAKKGYDLNISTFQELYKKRIESLRNLDALKHEINSLSKSNKKGTDFSKNIEKVKNLKLNLTNLEDIYAKDEFEFANFYCQIPNIPHNSVPEGDDEDDNVLVKEFLAPTNFNFKPKDHMDLGKGGSIDAESAVRMSGSRFIVLRNEIAQLHRALTQFMLDTHTDDGYEEHYVPYIVNSEILYGTGQLPKFEKDLYKVENGNDAYLIPTAEVPLTNLFANKTILQEVLPVRMVAATPCFRSEAGSYSKDIVGLIRQHQFEKVELVHIVEAEKSYEELDKLVEQSEKILQLLKLPYRIVNLCGGDLGFSAAKTYDIEVWIPSQDKYREIASISNCEDFQARRMLAKYKNKNRSQYLHTLNGSGVAVGRCMIAVLENYQNEDGSVTIPDVLIPYMKNKTEILKNLL